MDWLKDKGKEIISFLFSDVHILKKSYILRITSCIIILFSYICEKYWNILNYINFPTFPLFPKKIQAVIDEGTIWVLIFWIIGLCGMYSNCTNRIKTGKKGKIIISSIYDILDFIATLFLVAYSINMLIIVANKRDVIIWPSAVIAMMYLCLCTVINLYKKNERIEDRLERQNTIYCDINEKLIFIGADVFYYRKKYMVVKKNKKVKLRPYGQNVFTDSDYIDLELAVKDEAGKLRMIDD